MKRVPIDEVPAVDFVRSVVGAPGSMDFGGRLERWPRRRARRFTPTTLALIEDTLARGVLLSVSRRGGWRPGRFIAGDGVRSGRWWERHPQLELHFTEYVPRLVVEAVYGAERGGDVAPRTAADEVFAYLVAVALRARGRPAPIALTKAVLPWIVEPDLMARTGRAAPGRRRVRAAVESAAPWLEALQDDLTRAVVRAERSKARIGLDATMALGAVQATVLPRYLDAAEDRPDLARFLVLAGARLAEARPRLEDWQPSDATASLSRRAEAAEAAGAFLAVLERLEGWRARYAGVRFFEDDFEVAQLFLEDWAQLGPQGYARLRAVGEGLGALRPVSPLEDLP